jgi:hypothetical protein
MSIANDAERREDYTYLPKSERRLVGDFPPVTINEKSERRLVGDFPPVTINEKSERRLVGDFPPVTINEKSERRLVGDFPPVTINEKSERPREKESQRKCLCCGLIFISEWIGNRLCGRCKRLSKFHR